jgi:hypothetical protein
MKPTKQLLTRSQFAGLDPARFLTLRKYDGEFCELSLPGGTVLLCERMTRPISGHFYTASDRARFAGGEWFAAFRLASYAGQDWLTRGNGESWAALRGIALELPDNVVLAETVSGGAWGIDDAMAAGAEGVCAHALDAAWGEMLVHKAEDIFTVRVTATGGTQSARICDAVTGQDRGAVTLRGGKIDQVRAGSILRVAGMGLTDAGKIRQPQPCSEFLVRY